MFKTKLMGKSLSVAYFFHVQNDSIGQIILIYPFYKSMYLIQW